MEIEQQQIPHSNRAHIPSYMEFQLHRQIIHVIKSCVTKLRDDKFRFFIDRLNRVMKFEFELTVEDTPVNKKFNFSTGIPECIFCHKKVQDALNLIVHYLFHHRQYFFQLWLVDKRDRTFELKGLVQERFNKVTKGPKKKESFVFMKTEDKEKYYEIKKIFEKSFEKEDMSKVPKKKLMSRPIFADDDSDIEEKKFEDSQEDIKRQLKDRVFFHTKQMFRKVSEDSLFKESEDEISDGDLIQAEEEAIEAYDDIDDADKKFFKLWNRYVHKMEDVRYDKKKMIAFTLSEYCEFVMNFIRQNKATIQNDNLRNSLVMHLTTLHIYGLITKDDLVLCLLEYEKSEAILLEG